jgi:hypothetical protein
MPKQTALAREQRVMHGRPAAANIIVGRLPRGAGPDGGPAAPAIVVYLG